MYSLQTTNAFNRDVKRLGKKHYPMKELKEVVGLILEGANRESLASRYADHALAGNLQGNRELHMVKGSRGNWLLMYRLDTGSLTATMLRTGSHDELYGT